MRHPAVTALGILGVALFAGLVIWWQPPAQESDATEAGAGGSPVSDGAGRGGPGGTDLVEDTPREETPQDSFLHLRLLLDAADERPGEELPLVWQQEGVADLELRVERVDGARIELPYAFGDRERSLSLREQDLCFANGGAARKIQQPPGDSTYELDVYACREFSLVVLDERTGLAVEGAVVECYEQTDFDVGTSDADGRVPVWHRADTLCALRVSSSAHAPLAVLFEPGEIGDREVVLRRFEDCAREVIHLLDAFGRPLSSFDASVEWDAALADPAPDPVFAAMELAASLPPGRLSPPRFHSSEPGAVSVPLVHRGGGVVRFEAAGVPVGELRLPAGSRQGGAVAQTTRSLEGLVQLRFRVVDQGRPLPAAPVDLRHRTGAYGGRRIAGSRSDDEGAVQFLVPRDVADSLAVLVSAPGRTLLAQTVDLELPEQVLDLPAAGRLIVMVRGGSQVDLEYRTYQLHDRESGLFLAAEAVDSKDRLVFDRLPVGRPLALFQGSEFSSGVPLRDDLVVPADRKVLEWNDAPPPVIPR